MAEWKLCFVLLLPLTLCFDGEVTLVKTIGSKPDVTPICTNSTNSIIMLIVCKIRTKRTCTLLYSVEKGFEDQCDSRFKLMTQNQTVVLLHLTNLTSEDSGSYTCECSNSGGTYVLHLNITVEEDDDASSSAQILTLIPSVLIGTGIVIMIMITGVILGLICKRICCGKYQLRDGSRSTTSGLPVSETPLDQDDPDDPYTSLQRPENDVYQTISNPAANTVTVDSDNSDSSCAMYENV